MAARKPRQEECPPHAVACGHFAPSDGGVHAGDNFEAPRQRAQAGLKREPSQATAQPGDAPRGEGREALLPN